VSVIEVTYRPMRRDSPVYYVYRSLLAVTTWLFRAKHEGRSHTSAAGSMVMDAFGAPPDLRRRASVLEIGTYVGAVGPVPIMVPFVVVGAVTKTFWIAQAACVFYAVGAGWALVCGLRYVMNGVDRRRWVGAGRPAAWTPRGVSQPKNRDLVYVLLASYWVASKFLALFP
jgi:hypothetical protein